MSDHPVIVFAHPAYQLGAAFRRRSDAPFEEVRSLAEVEARLDRLEVLVCSRMWDNAFAPRAPKLRLIQSVSAGTDQFDFGILKQHGIRVASAQGVNERAVAEHATGLVLTLTRHIHLGRDRQHKREWRGMIGDPAQREQEAMGQTMLVVGLGRIGQRVAALGQALGFTVTGLRRRPRGPEDVVETIVSPDRLDEALAQADVVVLTCPHTPETDKLIGAAQLRAMKKTAYLVNVARGRVVDEPALIDALEAGEIAGAALDVTVEEPLPASSPLWAMENVVITPHSAGETQLYEDRVVDLLIENLARQARGETELKNGVV